MAPRLQLQVLLSGLGAEKVYFQAPSQDKMVYPCIMYNIDDEDAKYADNNPYSRTLKYQVTIIDRNPDTLIREKVAELPMSAFQRFFVVDGLNHFVYNIFF
jgi:hypothetical protein